MCGIIQGPSGPVIKTHKKGPGGPTFEKFCVKSEAKWAKKIKGPADYTTYKEDHAGHQCKRYEAKAMRANIKNIHISHKGQVCK